MLCNKIASAAREFQKWNHRRKHRERISYVVFEATDRIGGRILDIKLGGEEGKAPTRTSGGFANDTQSENVGCKCYGSSCPKINVEVGAGWFTGFDDIEVESCRHQVKTTNRRETLRRKKVQELAPMRKRIADRRRSRADPNRRLEVEVSLNCSVCPKNMHNRMFALSQGNRRFGKVDPPLEVNCGLHDGQDDNYSFLNHGVFYGTNTEGEIEMTPIVKKSRIYPSFDRNLNRTWVKPKQFLDRFWNMIDRCVDYEAYQFWYQYENWGCDASPPRKPFFYGKPTNSITWADFDVGFDKMGDLEPFWPEPLFAAQRKEWCITYHEMVQSFLNNVTSEEAIEASTMYNFYKNFNYFVSIEFGVV